MVSIHPRALLACLFLAVSLSVAIATPSSDKDQNEAETQQFLARLAEARQRVGDSQVSFREKHFFPFMENPVDSTGTLAFHPPKSFRRKVDQGSLTVCNGKTLWIYNPALQQAEVYDLSQTPFLKDALMAMTAALSAIDLPQLFQATLRRNNNGTTTLFLLPRTGALRKVASKIVLVLRPDLTAAQLEISSPEGDRTLTTFGQESHTRFSPGTFEFRPPPGTHISRPLAK